MRSTTETDRLPSPLMTSLCVCESVCVCVCVFARVVCCRSRGLTEMHYVSFMYSLFMCTWVSFAGFFSCVHGSLCRVLFRCTVSHWGPSEAYVSFMYFLLCILFSHVHGSLLQGSFQMYSESLGCMRSATSFSCILYS